MAPGSTAYCVMIVDDERLMRWSLAETLSEHGCDVIEAVDATSACSALGNNSTPPDVILLDLYLPDSADLDLLSTVRHLAPNSKGILITAYPTPDIDRQARERGAYDVLATPFDLEAMLAIVDRAEGAGGGDGDSVGRLTYAT